MMVELTLQTLVCTLVAAVIATAVIDGWALALKNLLGLPVTDWAMVGRWVGHLSDGRFVHRPIAATQAIPRERLIGWVFHYMVGIGYAMLYILIVVQRSAVPGLQTAILFGVATLAAPWLLMQPAMGNGFFAGNAAQPAKIRAINISVHVLFGAALYFAWHLAMLFAV